MPPVRDATRPTRSAAVDVEQRLVAAVSVQVGRHHAGSVRRLEHDSSGTVTEQHAGSSVGPVEQSRMSIGTDHQRSLDGTGSKELLGDAQRIDEAGAHCLHVECRTLPGTEPCLQTTSGRRIDAIRCRRAHHDEIQHRRLDAGGLESVECSAFGEIAGGFRFVDDVASPDPGAFPDPRITGFHVRGELGVRHDAFREARTGSCDCRVAHTASFSMSTDAMRSLMRSGTFFLISAAASMIARSKATTSALP